MKRWILMLLIGLTINLIDRSQQAQSPDDDGTGSGDDGEFSGVDPEEPEGSATVPKQGHERSDLLTPCRRQQQDADNDLKPVGAFRPQCMPNGEFKPMQCHTSTGRCWCVDKEGREIDGTMQVGPSQPKCTGRSVIGPSGELPSAKPSAFPERHSTVYKFVTPDSDINFDDPSTSKSMEMDKTTERKSKTQTTMSSDSGSQPDDGVNAEKSPFFFIFKDPLILAGIIGGAVLALLCIVLLIMFTIYRMRKKDEGSYALEEPKKSYGFAYTRARDQEFFA